ncbi:MAG: dihydropteroate synthase [Acidimicrobiales bacterium]
MTGADMSSGGPRPQLHPELRCGDQTLVWGQRTYVMGIVNITPDSFSDGGRFLDPVAAYDHACRLIDDGADIIDLGAESTRPGSIPIGTQEELARLMPVLAKLSAAGVRAISVDTAKAEVATAALQGGAAWINDVSGLADPALAGAVAAGGADALVVMHHRPMRADRAEDDVSYGDVIAEVRGELSRLVALAVAAGAAPHKVVVDPGIGFGKTAAGNLALLARAGELRQLGHAVLVGPSRKRFLSVLSGAATLSERDQATVGACCLAARSGADLVRVHDVAGVRRALAIIDATRATDPSAR